MSKPVGNFLCTICEKVVVVDALDSVEDFRIGTHLFCPDCREEITTDVLKRFIEDTTIPKTYRTMIEKCVEWEKKGDKR